MINPFVKVIIHQSPIMTEWAFAKNVNRKYKRVKRIMKKKSSAAGPNLGAAQGSR